MHPAFSASSQKYTQDIAIRPAESIASQRMVERFWRQGVLKNPASKVRAFYAPVGDRLSPTSAILVVAAISVILWSVVLTAVLRIF
jgi:hypothetical protein